MVKKLTDKGRGQQKTPCGFLTSTKRFARIGFHPSLDKSGAMKKIDSRGGPGQYDTVSLRCAKKQPIESM